MLPPSHVCKELARLNKRYRLAWRGRPPREEGELNPGEFVILELIHRSDYGSHDDPYRRYEPWDVEMDVANWDGVSLVPMKRANRGPIFQADGKPGRDWDDDWWVPIMVAAADEKWGLSIRDVFSGRLISVVRSWMYKTAMDHAREKALAKRAYLQSQIKDIAGDATDFWKFEASKSSERGIPIAKKHYRDDLRKWELKQEQVAASTLDQLAPLPPGS